MSKETNEKTYMLKMNIQNINEIGHRMEGLQYNLRWPYGVIGKIDLVAFEE